VKDNCYSPKICSHSNVFTRANHAWIVYEKILIQFTFVRHSSVALSISPSFFIHCTKQFNSLQCMTKYPFQCANQSSRDVS